MKLPLRTATATLRIVEQESSGNRSLVGTIRRLIARNGPLRFDRFMALALYHPRHGYYASGGALLGKRGDFYTSVSVGALFGELLARQFAEMWERLGRPENFSLVEAGAHEGQLAADILGWLKHNRADVFVATRYVIVEPSTALRKLQRVKLMGVKNVKWVGSVKELRANSLVGCIFANELLDAFPVRRMTLHKGKWQDLAVDWREKRFTLTAGRSLQPPIPNPQSLPNGYTTEICPAAAEWAQTAARKLKRGWMLLFDYGYEAAEYYAAHRTDGTLLCYHQHRVNNEPLIRVGEQDITAHVNFSAIARAVEAAGARIAGYTDQEHFVVGIGKFMLEALSSQPAAVSARKIREFQSLMHPEHLGRAMKLLALTKDISSPALSGLEYARKI